MKSARASGAGIGAVGRALAVAGLIAAAPTETLGAGAVDVELVLAVDCSYSVDSREYAQQIAGLVNAFRHPDVIDAIGSGEHKRIAVSLVQWTGSRHQVVAVPWTVVDASQASSLAESIKRVAREVPEGPTSITGLIRFATALFERSGVRGKRRVIDISSDGRNNQDRRLDQARDYAAALGITINGLTILNEDPTLYVYFERRIIAGPAAFVVRADSYESYKDAIVRKLIREIGAGAVAWRRGGPPEIAGWRSARR